MLTFIHGEVALPDERLEERRPRKTVASRASLAMSFIPFVLTLAMAAQMATSPQCQAGVTKAGLVSVVPATSHPKVYTVL